MQLAFRKGFSQLCDRPPLDNRTLEDYVRTFLSFQGMWYDLIIFSAGRDPMSERQFIPDFLLNILRDLYVVATRVE